MTQRVITTPVELIPILNKCFIHYDIHVAITILSHYLFNR